MGLFLDLFHVPVSVTNDALEGIYKAMSDGHDHGGDGNWRPHDSPLVRRMIELFTKRGLDRLAAVRYGLLAWESGENFKPGQEPPTAPLPGLMARWTPAESSLVKLYLEALPPAAWTLDDHMLAIELVVQTYLPADELITEADWLAAKAGLMGKVQANLGDDLPMKKADKILLGMPSTVAQAIAGFSLKGAEAAQLQFARMRAAENVRAISESVRHKMATLVLQDLERKIAGAPAGTSSLETELLDAFGALNRDWRRIAITEAGEAQLQGLVASVKPGTRLRRVERYDGACLFCRQIDRKVVTVVDAAKANKDPDTEVWLGKNNVGRSASPRKRVGNVLIEREPHEMWTIPAGLVHPNCRGRWVVLDNDEGGDPDFAAFLRDTLGSS